MTHYLSVDLPHRRKRGRKPGSAFPWGRAARVLWDGGAFDAAIARELSVSKSSVFRWRTANGLPKNRMIPKPPPPYVSKRPSDESLIAEAKGRIMNCNEGDDTCWNWDGKNYLPKGCKTYRTGKMYGPVMLNPFRRAWTSVGRIAYTLFRGEIPEGMTVDHICFNPLCVNPAHLQLLTLSENARRHPTKPSPSPEPSQEAAA